MGNVSEKRSRFRLICLMKGGNSYILPIPQIATKFACQRGVKHLVPLAVHQSAVEAFASKIQVYSALSMRY